MSPVVVESHVILQVLCVKVCHGCIVFNVTKFQFFCIYVCTFLFLSIAFMLIYVARELCVYMHQCTIIPLHVCTLIILKTAFHSLCFVDII